MTAAQECWIITLAPIHVKLAAQANYRLTCNFKEMYTKLDKDFKIMPGALKIAATRKSPRQRAKLKPLINAQLYLKFTG